MDKEIAELEKIVAIATDPGNANADGYMRGMANGLILALATIKGEEPLFLSGPLLNPAAPSSAGYDETAKQSPGDGPVYAGFAQSTSQDADYREDMAKERAVEYAIKAMPGQSGEQVLEFARQIFAFIHRPPLMIVNGDAAATALARDPIEAWAREEYRPGVSAGAAARQLCRSLGCYGHAPILKRMLEDMLADANTATHERHLILSDFEKFDPDAGRAAAHASFQRGQGRRRSMSDMLYGDTEGVGSNRIA